MERTAIIDLGTNTFHLFITEVQDDKLHILYKEKIAVKIGRNGISKGRIAADAKKRALRTLKIFRTIIDQFEVTEVKGVATSAIRNAKNGAELLSEIKDETGISIQMISGHEEAEFIYYGVKAAMELPASPQLIIDIGGGSVELIIGNNEQIHWRESFEIGAQRLLDQFHQTDPIPESQVTELQTWLEDRLSPLLEAIAEFAPNGLIGCSGTFDTLTEIHSMHEKIERQREDTYSVIPLSGYKRMHHQLLTLNRAERLAIPGMSTMRVDMIVVASCLIDFVVSKLEIGHITSCAYALKEGVLFSGKAHSPIVDKSFQS